MSSKQNPCVPSIRPERAYTLSAVERHEFVLLDVRKEAAFRESGMMVDGAQRCLPEDVAALKQSLSDKSVAVYCVHGHEVSQGAAKLLRQAGIEAVYVEGGFEAWREAKLPVSSIAQQTPRELKGE